MNCPKYIMCPLCYGCRAYSTSDLDCEACVEENRKKNICNKELHKDDVVADFITKNKVELDEDVQFQSAGTND